MKKTNSRIDCFKCRHFYTTWEPANPRGCKAFGFKTKQIPSDVILETSGEACLKYSPKTDQTRAKKTTRGWIA